ncbi:MAG: hypothetical protein H6625_05075 [Bdellovibrionaceae bacterium]|nr:hypothetical protein [Pseudobdellovibrionaceae bacterium]
MESLAPSLSLTVHVRLDLQQGVAIYDSLQNFCNNDGNEIVSELKCWLFKYDHALELHIYPEEYSIYRRSLFDLLNAGLCGASVYEKLHELETSMIQECRRNLEEACILLPYRGLLPLMLFMFPGLLLLILGPVLKEFLEVLN